MASRAGQKGQRRADLLSDIFVSSGWQMVSSMLTFLSASGWQIVSSGLTNDQLNADIFVSLALTYVSSTCQLRLTNGQLRLTFLSAQVDKWSAQRWHFCLTKFPNLVKCFFILIQIFFAKNRPKLLNIIWPELILLLKNLFCDRLVCLL